MDELTRMQLGAILNTLGQIEVKGFDNLDKLFGVMLTLRKMLEGGETKNG